MAAIMMSIVMTEIAILITCYARFGSALFGVAFIAEVRRPPAEPGSNAVAVCE
jgi:hypothetical protein